jgi:glycosyltransferase involved in cell wall biosynthesis
MRQRFPLPVVHLVGAMGGADHFWGKESVVAMLMREQRASDIIDPVLITFAPCRLATVMADEGFHVEVLGGADSHGLDGSIPALGRRLRLNPPAVLHSHGYRANIVAKMLRLTGRTAGARLVSTCHGWVETTAALRLYNAIDRWSTPLSDVTAVPDPRMLAALPRIGRRAHVANGVPELPSESAREQPLPHAGPFVAGTLGRVSEAKGILDMLAAARDFPDPTVVFVVAGSGELATRVSSIGGNVRYIGFLERPERYLDSLDVYVQASHSEGLSLSLLEAMRAGKAIVATDVGATSDAVVDGESALLVPARDAAALRNAVLRLREDPLLCARLGRNARKRFEADFHIARQHERYLELYVG